MNSLELYEFVTVENGGELYTEVWNSDCKLHIGTIHTETESNEIPHVCGIRVLKEYLTFDDLVALNEGCREHVFGVLKFKSIQNVKSVKTE
jgi:hypothetical protein